ncbi:LPS export ABC transporter periplasmic protein LptC [Thiohalomonas denitrificans]|uniref:Lipopolysaccharide export system protein LptC n=1 Tax=Thiohalomonas denitrificans TaxID=415747 RepID=A0A1G5PMC7_9GAMM|nr:LPS export ABC transporter periplasmic protein LptC [Thiohalomonas denitrificans]SCZ50608.1 lipopolysaccharide export system protein LptC [Thiohalomonas denitrificans]
MNRRVLLLIVSALGALLLSNWLSRQAEDERERREQVHRQVPDYFLSDFTATTMGPTGQPEYRLSAVRMDHFPDTDTAELVQPRVVLYGEGEANWHARSDRGQVGPGSEVVYLSGNVEIHQPGGDGGPPRMLLTDHLRMYPQRDYAETDAAVTITGPQTQINGVGMRAYFAQQRLELLSEVTGTHGPRR